MLFDFLQFHLYFFGAILYSIPFLLLFISRKESRKEMLIVGMICGFAGLFLSKYALQDYWNPPLYVFKF
jgi:nitrate/nitrite transporter NarK